MAVREKLYTVEEFWEIARRPENEGRRLELDDGVIIEMAASTPLNTIVTGRMIYFFNGHVIPRDLGSVTTPDGGFRLGAGRARQPDVAFISKARAPQVPDEFRVAPDLAVEVASPDEDVFKKVNEYISAGSRMVWTVYPQEKLVYVFQPSGEGELRVQVFGMDDALDGGDVLPGFRLPVREIFPE